MRLYILISFSYKSKWRPANRTAGPSNVPLNPVDLALAGDGRFEFSYVSSVAFARLQHLELLLGVTCSWMRTARCSLLHLALLEDTASSSSRAASSGGGGSILMENSSSSGSIRPREVLRLNTNLAFGARQYSIY